MCSETIIQESLRDEIAGIRVYGIPIYNIRYADDTVLLGESIKDFQGMIRRTSEHYGLDMNLKKSKYMLFTKSPITNVRSRINNTYIERVDKYKYLSKWVNVRNDNTVEIKARIETARNTFYTIYNTSSFVNI